jgi:RNA polymerase sigma-70 factor, ECF subfamily
MRTLAADDDAAFAELLSARLLPGYRLATLILRSRDEAEDAVHDAVLRAWRRRRTLRGIDQLPAWFDAVVLNVCRDRLRRARKISFVPLEFAAEAVGSNPETIAGNHDELERLFVALSFDQRAIVALRYGADMSITEIATRLGIPEGTVKSRLHTAMADLRGTSIEGPNT